MQEQVFQLAGFKPSRAATLRVLKCKLKMSYRKIKRVPFQGNSERCKVLRCLWAKAFFDILKQGDRVITIDETWLPATDYRVRKWKKRGMLNTLNEAPMGYKVNLIVAVSTDGEVWASLTQCNTDTDVMMMFMSRLATVLSSESSNWRENTVFTMDGAPYHKSSRAIFKHLRIRVAITAPYR